jgi:hypothetical protein
MVKDFRPNVWWNEKYCLSLPPEIIIGFKMCTITLSYNENDSVASQKLAALLSTGLFIQQEAPKELDIDYSDQSLYEESDMMALPADKERYTPEELRALLISDLNSIYGMKDAV